MFWTHYPETVLFLLVAEKETNRIFANSPFELG